MLLGFYVVGGGVSGSFSCRILRFDDEGFFVVAFLLFPSLLIFTKCESCDLDDDAAFAILPTHRRPGGVCAEMRCYTLGRIGPSDSSGWARVVLCLVGEEWEN